MAITMASGTRSTATKRTSGSAAAVSQVKRPLPQPSSTRRAWAPAAGTANAPGGSGAPESASRRRPPSGDQILLSSHAHGMRLLLWVGRPQRPAQVTFWLSYHNFPPLSAAFFRFFPLGPEVSLVERPKTRYDKRYQTHGPAARRFLGRRQKGGCHGHPRRPPGPHETGVLAGRPGPRLRTPGAGAPPLLLPPPGGCEPLAHQLLDTFGSLAGVLDASPDDLRKVPGVGKIRWSSSS